MQWFRAYLLTLVEPWGAKESHDGWFSVNDNGCIEGLGAWGAHPQGPQYEDLRPYWILPGLIDLHTHLPQLDAVALDGLPLLDWLETHIFPLEAEFISQEKARETARRFFHGLLAVGTTTAVVYVTTHSEATHIAFEEAERCGIRAVLGKVMMDRQGPDSLTEETNQSLYDAERLCERWHGSGNGLLSYAFTPRFAPSCSPTLMQGVGRLAKKYDAYIQTHVGESPAEVAWVASLFPEANSYVGLYRKMGLLGPRTLLAHGIYLKAIERRFIKDSGSSLVHCPRSNAFLASGMMPLRRWLEEGLQVGLGTDVGAGPSLSLMEEMAFACMVSKLYMAQYPAFPSLNLQELLKLATWNGAKALGLESRIGSLHVGKKADFIVVDPGQVDPRGLGHQQECAEHLLSRLLYRTRPEAVKRTYVNGQQVWPK